MENQSNSGIPDGNLLLKQKGLDSGATRWLLQAKATTGIRSLHFWIITGLFAILTYIYYGVLTTFHDVYIILFFYPLIYAALVYRLRGVIISGIIFLGILLPHTLIVIDDPA